MHGDLARDFTSGSHGPDFYLARGQNGQFLIRSRDRDQDTLILNPKETGHFGPAAETLLENIVQILNGESTRFEPVLAGDDDRRVHYYLTTGLGGSATLNISLRKAGEPFGEYMRLRVPDPDGAGAPLIKAVEQQEPFLGKFMGLAGMQTGRPPAPASKHHL